ncbi:MAG: class I adenylate-forming enzyme family protein [Gammaproteobacteria bacterium]
MKDPGLRHAVIYSAAADFSVPPGDDDAGVLALDPAYVVPRRIAYWAGRDPDRPFLEEVTGRKVGYGQMLDGIRRWARHLRDLGVRPGDRVISMLPQSIDAHMLWHAASCIGACEVTVNPELRGSFLTHALTDAAARLCFVRPESRDLVGAERIAGLQVQVVGRDGPGAAQCAPDDITFPAPEAPSCIIYTSGTTGPAKGVIVTWAQMSAIIGRLPRSWFSAADTIYLCHAMFHVTGRSPMPVMCDVGGRVVLREKFSAAHFLEDVRRHGCTSTTAYVALLLPLVERDDDAINPLRLVFGSHSGRMNARFAERFGCHVADSYGSTEAGFPIVLRWPMTQDLDRRWCGRLRRGYQARICDDSGAEVANGTAGELWIRPPHRALMTSGYLNRPEQTARAIVDGWYRTGDAMIRHDDGTFEFVDRIRDTIRRMGENISSSALEAVIVQQPGVAECAAIGVPDPVAGQEILLVVVPRPGEEVDPAHLYERLIGAMPRYMLPAYIAVRAEVPRTPTNKIRKTALEGAVAEPGTWRTPKLPRTG